MTGVNCVPVDPTTLQATKIPSTHPPSFSLSGLVGQGSLSGGLGLIRRLSLQTKLQDRILVLRSVHPVYPVSLTSHLVKTMERLVRKALVSHLERNKLMDDTQHGSRSGRSTLSQLLEHQDEILKELEEGNNVDAI